MFGVQQRNLLVYIAIATVCFIVVHGLDTRESVGTNATVVLVVDDNDNRIVNGFPISIRTAPYQVAVITERSLICGGSIIGRRWVLTAAHCIVRTPIVLRAGTRTFRSGGQTRRVTLAVRHSRYNPSTLANDIALLRVNRPFRFNENVQPVKLATQKARLPRHYFVSGWGVRSENAYYASRGLRAVYLNAVRERRCKRAYAGYAAIPSTHFCAAKKDKDSCSGDSGGPLVKNGKQYGIVSFGIGCARRRFPSVNTDVRQFNRWIQKTISKHSGSGSSGGSNASGTSDATECSYTFTFLDQVWSFPCF